jgi:hypothetical protein
MRPNGRPATRRPAGADAPDTIQSEQCPATRPGIAFLSGPPNAVGHGLGECRRRTCPASSLFWRVAGTFRDVIGLIATRDRCGTYSPSGARVCATIGRKRSASGGKTRNDRAHLEILSQTGRHACAWHAVIARCLRFPRAGGMRCVRHRPAGRGDGQSGPGHGQSGAGPRKSDVSAHPGKVGRGARRACPRDRRAGDGTVGSIHWVGR